MECLFEAVEGEVESAVFKAARDFKILTIEAQTSTNCLHLAFCVGRRDVFAVLYPPVLGRPYMFRQSIDRTQDTRLVLLIVL